MIGTTTNTAEYVGNASTVTAYEIPFRYDDPSWVKITATDEDGVVTDLELTTDFLLAGSGPATTGTFTTVVAVPITSTLTIYREAPGTQTLDLETGTQLPSASVEAQLDRLAMATMDRVTARAMEARIREIELTPGPAGATGATGTNGTNAPTPASFAGSNPNTTPVSIAVSGITDPSAANGTYAEDGTANGRIKYTKGAYSMEADGFDSFILKEGATVYYTADQIGKAYPSLVTSWTDLDGIGSIAVVDNGAPLTPSAIGQFAIVAGNGTSVYVATALSPVAWVKLSN